MYILLLNFSAYTDEYSIQDFIFWRKNQKRDIFILVIRSEKGQSYVTQKHV